MTNEEIRIECAKLDGWNFTPSPVPEKVSTHWGLSCKKPEWYFPYNLPDYTHSRNDAIALVLRVLATDKERHDFAFRLMRLMEVSPDEISYGNLNGVFVLMTANALHLSKAVLEVKGII